MISIVVLSMELAIFALLQWAGIEARPGAMSAVFILVFSVAFYATLQNKKYENVRWAVFFGYLFRVLLLFFDLYGRELYSLPNSGADSEWFYKCAIEYAHSSHYNRSSTFPKLMGAFFKYFGDSRLFGQFMVMLFSIVSILCAVKIFELLNIDKAKTAKAMWILCLLPNFAILSSIFLRESIVAMFISISLVAYVKWAKGKGELHFIFALVCVFAASYFHSGAIAAAVGYLLSRMVYNKRTGKLKLTFGNVFITALLLLASVYVLNRYGDNFLSKFSRLEEVDDIANTSTGGGSSYARYVGNSNTPLNMIIYTIPRIVFFLFTPMPWMWRGVSDIIAFCFSSCFYLWTICSFISFLRRGEQENRALVITLFIVAMCAAFVFGWGVSNSGTACRHREKMEVVWAVLLGLTTRVRKQGDLV